MNKPIKIAIITNIPTPYRKAQWEYYSKCEHLDITVFYCSNIEKDRQWNVGSAEGVKEVFIEGLSYKSFHFNPGILTVIFNDFDLFFVGGYGSPSLILAIILLKILKKHWVLIIDGFSPLKLGKENIIIKSIKRFFINGADAYFANGLVSSKYLQNYGIKIEKIFNQFLTVDIDYFMGKRNDSNKFRKEIREKYNLTKKSIVVMYAGRLVEHKGVQDLIKAVRKIRIKGFDVKVLIVGEGDFKNKLIKCSEQILPDAIFTGHVNPKDLYKYYYASDIFVLPTYKDPWGLVVNEAMSCGLPVIVSDAAGCSLDIVKNNGIIIKKGDIDELSSALEHIIEKNINNFYGKNSRKIIKNWKYENSIDEFLKLLNYCLN